MDLELLVELHPRLFHMAEDGTWPSIRERGLLSTKALVELYRPDEGTRREVLQEVRKRSVALESAELGTAWIRDQKPLAKLGRCLAEGTTRQQFLDELNGRVFFWLTEDRLDRLLAAYGDRRHVVLTLDTAALLERYADRVELAPYNTGAIGQGTPPLRSVDFFRPIADYPYERWRSRGPRKAVVELTVPDAVPDVADFVVQVDTLFRGSR